MELDLYQIDSFTDTIFKGNPACVVPLNEWLSDEVLLNIAKENAWGGCFKKRQIRKTFDDNRGLYGKR